MGLADIAGDYHPTFETALLSTWSGADLLQHLIQAS